MAIGVGVPAMSATMEIESPALTLSLQSPCTGWGGMPTVGTAPTKTPVLLPVSKTVIVSLSPLVVVSVTWMLSSALGLRFA